jgi:hypothetical protein
VQIILNFTPSKKEEKKAEARKIAFGKNEINLWSKLTVMSSYERGHALQGFPSPSIGLGVWSRHC